MPTELTHPESTVDSGTRGCTTCGHMSNGQPPTVPVPMGVDWLLVARVALLLVWLVFAAIGVVTALVEPLHVGQ